MHRIPWIQKSYQISLSRQIKRAYVWSDKVSNDAKITMMTCSIMYVMSVVVVSAWLVLMANTIGNIGELGWRQFWSIYLMEPWPKCYLNLIRGYTPIFACWICRVIGQKRVIQTKWNWQLPRITMSFFVHARSYLICYHSVLVRPQHNPIFGSCLKKFLRLQQKKNLVSIYIVAM